MLSFKGLLPQIATEKQMNQTKIYAEELPQKT